MFDEVVRALDDMLKAVEVMPSSTRELVVKILGDTSRSERRGQQGSDGRWASSARLPRIAGGRAFAATKVVDFLGDATKAAEDDAAAQRILANQLRETNNATDEQIASVEKMTNKLATRVRRRRRRPAARVRRAGTSSGSIEEAQTQLAVAMDVAAARGVALSVGDERDGEGEQRQRWRPVQSRHRDERSGR